MSDLPPTSSRWLSEHHGVITTAILRSHEVGEKTRTRLGNFCTERLDVEFSDENRGPKPQPWPPARCA